MVDSDILSRVKQRDHAAFKAMYEGCIAYVYAVVRRYVADASAHQDVIQEIFARVFLSVHTFDAAKGEFKYWLRRLVINQCLQHTRQGKSPAVVVPIDGVVETDTSVEEQLTNLSKEQIEGYLQNMPDGYKQVFMLVVIDEYSHAEVSEMVGISPETSRSQLSRAKNWLRNNLINNNKISLAGGL
ncbi:MAG: RNA polymerase sigma factor [Saprospiraceae bacterium]|nr:RNA polymerase sigma factor [Saprospiraceae bacterium]